MDTYWQDLVGKDESDRWSTGPGLHREGLVYSRYGVWVDGSVLSQCSLRLSQIVVHCFYDT